MNPAPQSPHRRPPTPEFSALDLEPCNLNNQYTLKNYTLNPKPFTLNVMSSKP